ncbi:MAG: GH3 auxin-responsive promoter family protein [Cyclobacteriaceae bacterium]|nr:GH3 auxin-responsive promoter family protein [Cyclobacteriaceae bacterium]MCH8516691.1 GH3 auxin-responsive promoter family protein [Cyclobacteriaceae bacterium]
MAILGNLLKKGIRIRESLEQEYTSPFDLQKNELRKLLISARNTAIGKDYDFKSILKEFRSSSEDEFYDAYSESLPIVDYDALYSSYWQRTRAGEKNVCWPGEVKYYALSSGTSGAPTKYIPVTKDMLRAIQRTGVRQILSLSRHDLSADVFSKGILMLGGSTHLNQNGSYFEGDLSGITASQIPFWFQHFYKPGKKIAKTREWDKKLDDIMLNAHKWDIGFVVGVPAWIQIMMEKIIAHHGVNHIHEIWPNLSVYVHGGVSFEPYKKSFSKLLGHPISYIETYLASEGFVAFQADPQSSSMRMVLNNGLFYEFIPFTDENFDADGNLKEQAKACMIHQVEENKEYALLLSTCAGTWRYMIGDTIKFTNKLRSEIKITGRTKHFLSLCGEHLSVENMNQALQLVSEEMDFEVKEFTVCGIPHGSLFAHHWYIGVRGELPDPDSISRLLDQKLKELNDDYAVERKAALKEIFVDVLPASRFYDFMELKGKVGGQNKFPRVLKKEKVTEWQDFLANKIG